jgi:beta-lactam-binding protein with PASTA domain
VQGLEQDAAVAALQNAGFKAHAEPKRDPTVDSGRVINTDPAADSAVSAGDDITVYVSTGAEQLQVPDCLDLTYDECVSTLKDAGFVKVKQSSRVSNPAQKGRVVETSPPAKSTSASTSEITIFVGAGPGTAPVPPVARQPLDVAERILGASKFTNLIQVPVDSPEPTGQVVGTAPPAGEITALDAPIQVQVSKGNQFVMPPLMGKVWDDILPLLQGLGWTGTPNNGNEPAGDTNRNKVIRQDPQPGQPMDKTGTITLTFGS